MQEQPCNYSVVVHRILDHKIHDYVTRFPVVRQIQVNPDISLKSPNPSSAFNMTDDQG